MAARDPLSPRTRKRFDDAMELARTGPPVGVYADSVIDRLKADELIDSVSLGQPTEGGGMLISAARLRYELDQAHRLGGIEALEQFRDKLVNPDVDPDSVGGTDGTHA